MTQNYGRLFNARIELRPANFGGKGEEANYQLIVDFCDDLLGFSEQNAFITLVERDQLGMRAVVLAYVASDRRGELEDNHDAALAAFDAWSKKWRFEDRIGPNALSFQVIGAKGRQYLYEHWRNVLDLCAGLDPEECLDGEGKPLLSLLNLKRASRSPGPVRGPVFFTSPNIASVEMKAATTHKMGFVSAFDDRAWDRITEGWELNEFQDRHTELTRRKDEVADLERTWGAGTPEFTKKLSELLSAWPTDPREWPRSWTGWWTPRRA